jgi:hypothetical protein
LSASPIEPPSVEPGGDDSAAPETARARLSRFWRRREEDERAEAAPAAEAPAAEAESAQPPSWTARLRRRLAKNAPIFKSSSFIALEVAATLVALLLGVIAVAWWQLSKGPQELAFLEGVVESELSKARDGRPVDIERVELAWTAQRGLQLRAVDVAVLDRQRRRLSTSREVSIGISPLHLLIAQVRVTRAEFVGGEVSVTRRPNGETLIAFGPPGVDPDIIIPPSAGPDETLEQQVNRVLDGLAETLRPVGPGGRLRALSVREARFTLNDEMTGGAWRAESASFELSRQRQALTFTARARLEGPRGPAPAALTVRTDAAFRAAEIEFTSRGVRPRAIFSPAAMGIFAGLDAPMDATVIVGLDRAEGVTRLEGDVQLGRGSADLPGGRFAIDGGRLHGAYDLERDILRIDRISLAGARNQINGQVEIAGASALLRAESEGVATFTAAAPSVVLDVPGVFDEGAAMRNVRISGRFDRAAQQLSFQRIEAGVGAARLTAEGRLYWAEAADGETYPGVALDGRIEGVLEARDFVRLWPRNLARGARAYLGDAIVGADVSGFTVKADVTPNDVARGSLRPEALEIAFTFADADFRFLPEMSPVARGAGAGRIHGNGLEILVSSAQVEGLTVSSGTVRVPSFGSDTHVAIDVRAAGDARSAFRLLEQEPVDLAGRLPMQTETVVGEGAFALGLRIPLGSGARGRNVQFTVNGQFTGVGGLERDRRITFSEGRLNVRGDHRAVTVSGPVRAGASSTNIEWVETLSPRMAAPSRYSIAGDFDVEDLRRLGYPLDDVASGRVGVTLRGAGAGYDVDSAEVALDLRNAALSLPRGFWVKRAGAPASARFNVARGENGMLDLTNIEVRGPGLTIAQGEARVAPGARLERVVLARVAVDQRADARIAVERANDGAFVFDISGGFFDVSPWLAPAAAPAQAQPRAQPVAARTPTQFRGRVRVAQLGLRAGARLREARAEFAAADDALVMASLEGLDPAGGAFTFGLGARPSDPRGRITLRTSDAGFAARALLGSENVRGGAATVDGEWTPGATTRAAFTVEMRDFTAVRVPAMTQLLSSVASLRGLAEMLGGAGMTFNSLTADVRLDGSRVTIAEARAAGPSLGLTASGAYDMGRDDLDLNGVVVPSPGINSMLGAVPLVGQLFVSREGEGVLGVTYSLDGPIAQARVGVNPLSALAPGILRRIFEAPQPRETAPSAAPRRATPRTRARQN